MALKQLQRLFTHFINYRTGTEHGKYRFHWKKRKKPGEFLPFSTAFMSQTNLGFVQIVEILRTKSSVGLFFFTVHI